MVGFTLWSPALSLILSRTSIVLAFALISVRAHAQTPAIDLAPTFSFDRVGASATGRADWTEEVGGPRSSTTATEERSGAFHLVLGAFYTAASTDLAVSMYQIGRGVARERAFGASWQDSPVAFATTKSAMVAAFAYGLQHMHKERPKRALLIGIAATAVEGWLVVRGARISSPAR